MIQSSDYRVLSIGGYSYMDYITGAGIYSKEKIDMTNFGIHSSTIDKCSIPTLKRNGLQDGGTYGLVDNLTYNGNQLTKISDSVEDPTYVGAFNFKDGADNSTEYTYDAVGNMTSDKNKGITSITYNDINQPQKITFSDGKTTEYVYSYDETKLQTVHKTQQPQTSATTTYCGNMIYENGALKRMLVDGGYVTFSGATPVYHFYIQDHLGNNRVVAKANGTVEQINHYYPYGGLMADICTGSDIQPYKYNGKELDRMHGLDWYDHGARHNDAAIGRWHSMDPLCEKYYDVSPYVYCLDNPINAIDTDGEKVYVVATTLPGAQKFPFATHTYTLVTGHGNPQRYAYGSDKDGISGIFSGNLERCYYIDDEKTMNTALKYIEKNDYSEKLPDNIKNIIEIEPPVGMSSNEFDIKVVNVAKQFDNNKEIQYNVLTNSDKTGNCNTSTTTLLMKSGVPKEKIDKIGKQLNGIVGGWGEIRPWDEEERKKAINEH